eukprot:260252_1
MLLLCVLDGDLNGLMALCAGGSHCGSFVDGHIHIGFISCFPSYHDHSLQYHVMAVDVRFESWFHHRWLCFYSIQRARAMPKLVVRLLLHRIHALLLHIQLVVDVLVIRVAISIQKCECNAQNNGDVIQWLVCGVIPLLHHKKHVFDIKTES